MALPEKDRRAIWRLEAGIKLEDNSLLHATFMEIVKQEPELFGFAKPQASPIRLRPPAKKILIEVLVWIGMATAVVLAGLSPIPIAASLYDSFNH